MLVNTALAQSRVEELGSKAKILVSFPDPSFPEARFNSLIVAPSIYTPNIMSFTVEKLDGSGTFLSRQTGIDVSQARHLVNLLSTWIKEEDRRSQPPTPAGDAE